MKTSDLKTLTVDKQTSMASKSNRRGKAKLRSWKWEKHILFSKTTDFSWLKPTTKLHPWGNTSTRLGSLRSHRW